MATIRPFLSYSSDNRSIVERIAEKLIARGLLPIYDHWWMRSAPSDNPASTEAELRSGVNHADAFLYFDSLAARQSTCVQYECNWAMERTCSDAPDLRMVRILLDGPTGNAPHWFDPTIDMAANANDPDAFTDDLLKALGSEPCAGASASVRACRELARASDFERLRAELFGMNESARCEAAILLVCLDESINEAILAAAVRELECGLSTVEAERVLLALGKLQAKAAPAIDSLTRFVEGDDNPYARARAVRVLGRIGPNKGTISALIHIATSPSGVRKAALTELGNLGCAAAAAVPTLVKIAETEDRHLRLVALTALGNIGDCSCEVLVAVLKALAETEPEEMSASQLHHNAMCILNQLAPKDSQLAGALLPASQQSQLFMMWFREQFPKANAAINGDVSNEQLDAELLASARHILSGSRLVGGRRPF